MRLADVFEQVAGSEAPVRFRAYDGSSAGRPDAEITMVVRTPVAVNYLAQAPGALGLARAYVSGHLDLEGDMYTALASMWDMASSDEIPLSQRLKMLRAVGWVKLVNRVPPPPQEMRRTRLLGRGLRRHTKGRDAEAISHHYDVSNAFYEMVLGPSMAYTCAAYPAEDATLEQAQFHKHDLVARKLGLTEGMRLLDVGCGWGGMVMHAAEHYGVRAIGVTLSKQQAEWAQKTIAERGLGELAEVRHLDYRDVPEGNFDAVSSIGLTEHIGKANLPAYFSSLYAKLRPGGRLLNHCITRARDDEPSMNADGVINRYVFPDGELEAPGYLVSRMTDAGFEVRHLENLREHYAKTLTHWCANLDERWDDAVAEVGRGTARVWRLYMAGSRLGFERNVVQLHQILGVKLGERAASGFELRPRFEPDTGG
ncbi:SAM-dependent methyltransferase [Allonocardiopsis opalescens]|uniref:SAM-dependent methyltransferase n=1 Tax=Allonocardiopsis opalescens TaxID=1144618 RepID=UPI000D070C90|nr:cyclopropane-fatty-acyl-phospholipid synthase family protein [Allonocardiopsis opalescens]